MPPPRIWIDHRGAWYWVWRVGCDVDGHVHIGRTRTYVGALRAARREWRAHHRDSAESVTGRGAPV